MEGTMRVKKGHKGAVNIVPDNRQNRRLYITHNKRTKNHPKFHSHFRYYINDEIGQLDTQLKNASIGATIRGEGLGLEAEQPVTEQPNVTGEPEEFQDFTEEQPEKKTASRKRKATA